MYIFQFFKYNRSVTSLITVGHLPVYNSYNFYVFYRIKTHLFGLCFCLLDSMPNNSPKFCNCFIFLCQMLRNQTVLKEVNIFKMIEKMSLTKKS